MAAARKAGKSKSQKPAREGAAAPFDLVAIMAEASWSQADRALAQAVLDAAAAEQAARPLKRQALDDAMLMLNQSLSRAARARGIALFGAVGEVTAFDPDRHETSGRAAKMVRIVTPGVMRGAGPSAEVLVKAVVAPSRARVR